LELPADLVRREKSSGALKNRQDFGFRHGFAVKLREKGALHDHHLLVYDNLEKQENTFSFSH
jgi:hypothetical protein